MDRWGSRRAHFKAGQVSDTVPSNCKLLMHKQKHSLSAGISPKEGLMPRSVLDFLSIDILSPARALEGTQGAVHSPSNLARHSIKELYTYHETLLPADQSS